MRSVVARMTTAGEQTEEPAGTVEVAASRIDWERIEIDYRAGIMSLREIAGPFGITEGAVRKRAKRDGWERDLESRIRARADALVRKSAVRQEVRDGVRTAIAASEHQIIEANAERIAQVRSGHRAMGQRLNGLGLALLAELEAQSADPEAFAQLAEIMRNPEGADKRNEIYLRVISTPARVDSARKVTEMLKTAVGMEREAYGIGPADGAPPPPPALTNPIDAARRIAFALQIGLKAAKQGQPA